GDRWTERQRRRFRSCYRYRHRLPVRGVRDCGPAWRYRPCRSRLRRQKTVGRPDDQCHERGLFLESIRPRVPCAVQTTGRTARVDQGFRTCLVLRLKIALTHSPPRRAGVARSAGVVSSAKSRTCRSDHYYGFALSRSRFAPVCAAFGGFAPSYWWRILPSSARRGMRLCRTKSNRNYETHHTSIAKLYGGWLTDRIRRRKTLCAAGLIRTRRPAHPESLLL